MRLDEAETRQLISTMSLLAGVAGLVCVLAGRPRRLSPAAVTLLAAFATLLASGAFGFAGSPVDEIGWTGGLALAGTAAVLIGAILTVREARAKDRAFQLAVAESESRRRELDRLGQTNVSLEDELQRTRARLVTAERGGTDSDAARAGRDSGSRGAGDAIRAEKRLRAIFEGALEGMATLERESLRIVTSNPALARMTGLTGDELGRLGILDLCTAGQTRPTVQDLQRAARERRVLSVEILRKDGDAIPAEVSVAVIGAGADAQLLAVVRDAVERRTLDDDARKQLVVQSERVREAEAAVREAVERAAKSAEEAARLRDLHARKDHFVTTVSHELRTPLTSIGSFSEILLTHDDVEPAVRREFLEIIHRESQRLTRLVSDVLDLARIEAGEARLQLGEFDVRDVIGDSVASVSGAALERGVDVRVKTTTTPRTCFGDRDKIHQLAINLVANAVKFSPEGGEVQINVRDGEKPGRVEISVTDHGPGIPVEDLERVFEKFRRSDDGPAKGVPGTGLGLAICREIAAMHGGRVWAESTPGQGSCFRVELPLAEEGRRIFAARRPDASEEIPVVPVERRLQPVGRAAAAPAKAKREARPAPADAGKDAIEWSTTGSLPPLRVAMTGGPRDAGPASGELPPIR